MSYFSKKYIFTRTKFFNVHSLKFNKTWAIVVSRLNSHWKCNLILLPMTTMQFVMWSKAYCAKLIVQSFCARKNKFLMSSVYYARSTLSEVSLHVCVCVLTYVTDTIFESWVISHADINIEFEWQLWTKKYQKK